MKSQKAKPGKLFASEGFVPSCLSILWFPLKDCKASYRSVEIAARGSFTSKNISYLRFKCWIRIAGLHSNLKSFSVFF